MAGPDDRPLAEAPDPPARIPPLAPEAFGEEERAFFGRWTGGFFANADANPPLQTFAHHPRLADLFSQFNIHLLTTSTLPVRERQIAILRTAWITRATYMWSSHLATTLRCALEPELFAPVQAGAGDPYFTDFERTVILATEELIRDRKVGERNWRALEAVWDRRQLLDFLFTVGAYVMIAGVMRTAGIERQEDLRILAARYGAPHPETGA